MNFFIIPAKDISSTTHHGIKIPTFDKTAFDSNGNYTGLIFSDGFDSETEDDLNLLIKSFGIEEEELDNITPRQWYDVFEAKESGTTAKLKMTIGLKTQLATVTDEMDALNVQKPKRSRKTKRPTPSETSVTDTSR